MSWFHRRDPQPGGERKQDAAHLAKMRATDDLMKIESRWPEVIRVSASLRELSEQNHFAASVRMIFQGGDPE